METQVTPEQSTRDTLPPHRRDLWDRIWARLLAPVPDEPPGDDPNPDHNADTTDTAA